MIYGGAKKRKNFVVVTLGTGLGSGIVVDGNLVYGHDGAAGELGHVKITKDPNRSCGCGRCGCLETYVSFKGLTQTTLELLKTRKGRHKLCRTEEDLSFDTILNAAMAGDLIAKEAFDITGEYLGEALANLVAVTAPDYIFISGPMSKAGEFILAPARKALDSNLMNIWKGKVRLLTSVVEPEKAHILGAAALAIKEMQRRSHVVGIRKVI
jgi:glucokinase